MAKLDRSSISIRKELYILLSEESKKLKRTVASTVAYILSNYFGRPDLAGQESATPLAVQRSTKTAELGIELLRNKQKVGWTNLFKGIGKLIACRRFDLAKKYLDSALRLIALGIPTYTSTEKELEQLKINYDSAKTTCWLDKIQMWHSGKPELCGFYVIIQGNRIKPIHIDHPEHWALKDDTIDFHHSLTALPHLPENWAPMQLDPPQ